MAVHEGHALAWRGGLPQALADTPRQKYSVGVHLQSPAVAPKVRLREDPAPDPKEDHRVEGKVVARVVGNGQGAADDVCVHAVAQPSGHVAEDGVAVAAKDPKAVLELLPQEQELVGVRHHQHEAEERGVRVIVQRLPAGRDRRLARSQVPDRHQAEQGEAGQKQDNRAGNDGARSAGSRPRRRGSLLLFPHRKRAGFHGRR
mmetsp:Transcript_71846/g.222092  ORF Transcript_71846/g.222092 Transcript_71846/m.222092 type:complete len:202 (+) Transcript_71846:376-981(+)